MAVPLVCGGIVGGETNGVAPTPIFVSVHVKSDLALSRTRAARGGLRAERTLEQEDFLGRLVHDGARTRDQGMRIEAIARPEVEIE